MNRRGFLGAIGVLFASSALRLEAALPAPVRGVEFSDFSECLKQYYSEAYEDIVYREHPLLGLLRKQDA